MDYKYKCNKCGEITISQRITEYKLIEQCPTCQGYIKRIYGVPAVHWKCDGAFGKSK
jgi:putative FmdB family regulatory protein